MVERKKAMVAAAAALEALEIAEQETGESSSQETKK